MLVGIFLIKLLLKWLSKNIFPRTTTQNFLTDTWTRFLNAKAWNWQAWLLTWFGIKYRFSLSDKCIIFLHISWIVNIFGNLVRNTDFDCISWKIPCLYQKMENTIRFHRILIKILVNFVQLWIKINSGM